MSATVVLFSVRLGRRNTMTVATAGCLLFVVLVSLLFSASTVLSQNNQDDWRSVGTWTREAATYSVYYSPSRTPRRDGLVRAWFKITYPEGSNTSHMFALMQFNCHTGRYRILQQGIFSRNGGGTGSIKPTEWQYPVPESVQEMEYKAMCRQSTVVANSRRS
jgi:hypothetical protein